MTRILALVGLYFLVVFALLPDNALVSHPVHHDDYSNLAVGLDAVRLAVPRPVSTVIIAAVASLGPQFAYIAQNLLVLLCLYLSLRFVELFVHDGQRLPMAGYAAAAIIALSFPPIVDWTRYFGLLTNLSSASLGLAAMCVMALMRLHPSRFGLLVVPLLALVVLSFLAKEDFALPLLITAGAIAVTGERRRWILVTMVIGLTFAATLAYNRAVGSVFVSGSSGPDHPYFMNLTPASLWSTYSRMLLEQPYSRALVLLALAAVAAAMVGVRQQPSRALRLLALPAIALSILAPYAIFPNHVYQYYAFLPVALLACAVVAGSYTALEPLRGRWLDFAGLLLVAGAILGSYSSYDSRRQSAQWYSEVADYNRAITRFLVDHQDRLADRPVAVYGVAGLSPWSLSTGGYLARILGRDRRWDVFVPKSDVFYPFGAQRGGSITVHPADQACAIASDPRTVHLAIAPDGRLEFADDCRQALALATPHPVIETWGPQEVSAQQRDAGFNMYFTGQELVRGLEVQVAGQSTPMTHARRGRLMTTSVPPQPAALTTVPIAVVRQGRVVFTAAVKVR